MKRAVSLFLTLTMFLSVSVFGRNYGDVTGDNKLTSSDSAMILQNVLNTDAMPFDDEKIILADVTADGIVSATDASSVLQKVLDSDYLLPVEQITETTTQITTSSQVEYIPADRDNDGNPVITWRLADTKYDTEDTIVMGLSIRDFGVTGDGVTDVTSQFQKALNMLGERNSKDVITGGTLFVPEGKYVIKGNLTIPKGVTLAGDWEKPVKGEKIKGTVLMAYADRNNADGKPFITMQPNTGINGINIWYPEQKADNIIPYPATIWTQDPDVWGSDGTYMENITLVNSYFGIQQGPIVGSCSNVYNLYGTPLNKGMDMDGIADVSRWQNIDFSPEYWAGSGLDNAPVNNEHINYIKNNGVGISLGRIDWSYLSFYKCEGYNIALKFKESMCESSYADGEFLNHTFPNGQCYDLDFKNCVNGIYVDGRAEESITNLKTSNCEIGINLVANAFASDGLFQVYNGDIQGNTYSIKQNTNGHMQVLSSMITGLVYCDNGNITVSNSDFKTTSSSVQMAKGSVGGIFTGNTYVNDNIIDEGAYEIIKDDTKLSINTPLTPPEISVDRFKAKNNLFVVTKSPYNAKADRVTDDTSAIQKALDDAGNVGGGIVFIPPGSYRIDGSLTVPTGVELLGSVDVARMPIKLGSIFDTYNMSKSAVTLKEGSAIRGIVFNVGNQSIDTPVKHPYVITGDGKDISIVNIGLRNVTYGVDLFTNKCDNHYVHGLAGWAYNTAVRVGSGSENGRIYNSQFNRGTVFWGEETKWGPWENSVPTEEKDSYEIKMNEYSSENGDIIVLGDCSGELLFNNFNIFGSKCLYLKKENNGPSGYVIGHGVDMCNTCIYIEDINSQGMDFINTQLVASKDWSDNNSSSFITIAESCDDEVDFFLTRAWAVPHNNVIAKSGTLNLYGFDFETTGTLGIINPSESGRVNIYNSVIRNTGDTVTSQNPDKVSVYSTLFKTEPKDNLLNNKNNIKIVGRWAVPENVTLNSDEKYVFAESFADYPRGDSNGIKNAMGNTDSFSEYQSPSDSANCTVGEENSNEYVRLYNDSTANQSYIYNHSTYFESGNENSIYTFKTRIKFNSVRTNTGSGTWIGMNTVTSSGSRDSIDRIVTFNGKDMTVSNSLGSFEKGKWYVVEAVYDIREATNKKMTVTLYDDNGNKLAATGSVTLPQSMQTDSGLGHFIINSGGGTEGISGEYNDILVDYVVVTQKK